MGLFQVGQVLRVKLGSNTSAIPFIVLGGQHGWPLAITLILNYLRIGYAGVILLQLALPSFRNLCVAAAAHM